MGIIELFLTLLPFVLCTEEGIVTSQNVDEVLLKDKFSLVLFYAPWQKDCKPVIEMIDNLRTKFQSRADIFIGKADIYNDLKLATKFMIEDYFVLKYFVKGSQVAESYEGNLNEEDIEVFINEQSNTELSEDDFKRSLIKLDTETFDRYIRDKEKTALVLFYAKWSAKCKTLLETMKRAARHFKKEPHCLFAYIDSETNHEVMVKEKIGEYPAFKFYPINNKDGEMYLPGKFDERWSEKNITKYMSIHCKSKVAEQHVMDKLIGKIKDLDIFTRNFIMRSGNSKEQERIIRETVLKINILPPAKRFTADYYVEIMRSVLKQGEGFLDEEITRIDKMLLAEMLEKHKDEMTEKRNILQHFRLHRNHYRKDEL